MSALLIAALYGLVQGVTEWLPVSSTGHMLLLDALLPLPLTGDFRAFFLVAVQLGSLCALPRFLPWREVGLWRRVLPAAIPAALLGLWLDDCIDASLSTPRVIAAMLILYGVAFLVIGRGKGSFTDPAALPMGRAMAVGFAQALALIPGTSRSGATMLGGLLAGLTPDCAALFSFALAVPTMLGAAGLRGAKLLAAGVAADPLAWAMLAVAALVAYLTSSASIEFLRALVTRRGFAPFGLYRIALGVAVLICTR